jgi:Ca2+-binding EF-hand superfamily protein
MFSAEEEKNVETIFSSFDLDGNGTIEMGEMRKVVEALDDRLE